MQTSLDALRDKYNTTIRDETQGALPLNQILGVILTTLDNLCSAGEVVREAFTTGFPLQTIVLYPTDEITTGCYTGAMADYEVDEATLYIATGRILDQGTQPLCVGCGAHNVGTDFRTVLAHEMGHLVMQRVEMLIGRPMSIVYDEKSAEYWSQNVSTYAATDDHELFAEAFAAWTHPEYGTKANLPEALVSVFVDAGISVGALEKLQKARRSSVDVTLPDGTVVTGSKIDEILESVSDGDWAIVQGTLSPAMTQTFEDAGYTEIAAAGLSTIDDTLFDLVDSAAEKYATEHGGELIAGLKDSTHDMMRGTVEDALTEGWSRPEFETELRNNYGFSEQRANTIAHNELAMAHSYGRIDVAKEAGATKKVWLLSDDHDDEEDCDCSDAADAGEVDMEDSFTDDENYDFPPGHVNCLCDWAAKYGSDDDDDDDADEEEDDDDAGKMAKGQTIDNVPAEYDQYILDEADTAANENCMTLSNAAMAAAPSNDITGQRISGKADSATRAAVMNYENAGSRCADHRRAYEFHVEAAYHYQSDIVDADAQHAHEKAAAAHKVIVDELQEQPPDTVPVASPELHISKGVDGKETREIRMTPIAKRAIDSDAHAAHTSPINDADEPSDEQKKAGNYKMGHLVIGGIRITIENPAGSRRRPEWETLKAHYGYIKLTEGADGDHIDCFVKPGTDDTYQGSVFVIDQMKANQLTFDEHKVMIGFHSKQSAVRAYLGSYQSGWKLGKVTRMTWAQFKEWVTQREHTKPVAP